MKICIDAGHNFSSFDTGAQGFGLKEQHITFYIAKHLKLMLEKVNIKVVMTRYEINDNLGTDVSSSLKKRCDIANKNNCDLFVSLHCNAGGGKGAETYIVAKGGKAEKLAGCVQQNIVKSMHLADRGVKAHNGLYVLKNTNMPAILVETAFIDNKEEASLLKNNQEDFAKAIFKGICEYLRIDTTVKEDAELEKIISVLQKLIEINDVKAAVDAIKKAKAENSSLYWILYKLAYANMDYAVPQSSPPESAEKCKIFNH